MPTPSEDAEIEDETLVSGDSLLEAHVGVASLAPGKTIGPYVVLARLAIGSLGVVYAAYDPERARRVAIRLLRPPTDSRDRAKQSAENLAEAARAIADLRDPNVVEVYEVERLHGVTYMVMEFVEGPTLSEWMSEGPHPWTEVLACFRQVAQGLAAAHRAGLLHRDFRPAEVRLDPAGQPKIGDFGLAGRVQPRDTPSVKLAKRAEDDTSVDSLEKPLTRMGQWIGVPAYMAPEQYAGESVDARADQFSFCVAFYEALYGERPFGGRTVQALMLAIEEGRIAQPSDKVRVPRWLRDIVVRGLAHDPSARWPSMDAILEALARAPGRTGRRGVAIAALAIATLSALAALSTHSAAATRDEGAQAAAETTASELAAAVRAGEDERAAELCRALADASEDHEAQATWRALAEAFDARHSGPAPGR